MIKYSTSLYCDACKAKRRKEYQARYRELNREEIREKDRKRGKLRRKAKKANDIADEQHEFEQAAPRGTNWCWVKDAKCGKCGVFQGVNAFGLCLHCYRHISRVEMSGPNDVYYQAGNYPSPLSEQKLIEVW